MWYDRTSHSRIIRIPSINQTALNICLLSLLSPSHSATVWSAISDHLESASWFFFLRIFFVFYCRTTDTFNGQSLCASFSRGPYHADRIKSKTIGQRFYSEQFGHFHERINDVWFHYLQGSDGTNLGSKHHDANEDRCGSTWLIVIAVTNGLISSALVFPLFRVSAVSV